MREVKLDLNIEENKKMVDLVAKRKQIADRAVEIQAEFKKLTDELKKKEHEMNRLQDKSRPTVEKWGEEWEMGEFEMIEKVDVVEGELIAYISDQIEDMKEILRAKKKEGQKKKEKEDEKEEKQDEEV